MKNLIERLQEYSQSLGAYHLGCEFSDFCDDIVSELERLQTENTELIAANKALTLDNRYVRSGNGTLRKIPSRPVAQVVTHGYKVVCLSRENKQKCIRVHKIVCSEFNGAGGQDAVVNHIDGNKLNNRADNLEWVSQKENWEHAIRTGLAVPTYGIKEVVCLNTGRTYKSAAEAARAFGTWPGVISKICLGDRDSFYGYKFKYTGHEKKPRKRKQLNQNNMADMLLSYSIKARESKSKKELKKVIYELKEEMDLKKYDVTEMEMLEGME